MSDSPDAARAPQRRFRWLRAASDRVPTAWFAGIATGLFLVATAAFGGLATAAPAELARLEPGEEHLTSQRSLTVQRAVLIDELPGTGLILEDGQRVLAVVVEAVNEWDQPLLSTGAGGVAASFWIEELDDDAQSSVARIDDATIGPVLQPGVPAELVYVWAVDADAYSAGDQLTVTLADLSLYTGSFVTQGQWWDDPSPAARMTLALEDVGAGADQETDGDG
ncbi:MULTISPECIES: hypothetical protein [Microbacterium]|uniref:hypothetical protein n=1 Tax=Microbacterium TaxID=33882 RepID=UPI000D64AF37|nr:MULTISPECIES: hypothetical protein [Microbacterium]